MSEQVANNAQTTLASGINNSTTTITVASHSLFPNSPNYRILINSELMLVTGGAGTNTWTVTRGVEGTTAASATSGAKVVQVLTKQGLLNVIADNSINSLVEDTAPQLGGNLDLNGHNIGSVTPTVLGYVDPTSSIQTQLNTKANTSSLATVATTGAYSDLSGKPTLGTAASLDTGITANHVVELDGSAKLPAVDGSQLTNLPTQTPTLSDVLTNGNDAGGLSVVNLGAVGIGTTPEAPLDFGTANLNLPVYLYNNGSTAVYGLGIYNNRLAGSQSEYRLFCDTGGGSPVFTFGFQDHDGTFAETARLDPATGNLLAGNFSGSSSGSNSGDQDLSPYATSASLAAGTTPVAYSGITGAPSTPNLADVLSIGHDAGQNVISNCGGLLVVNGDFIGVESGGYVGVLTLVGDNYLDNNGAAIIQLYGLNNGSHPGDAVIMSSVNSGSVILSVYGGNHSLTLAHDGTTTIAGTISANNLSGTNTGDQDLSGYALTSSLATVATSGLYSDLSGAPTGLTESIPLLAPDGVTVVTLNFFNGLLQSVS